MSVMRSRLAILGYVLIVAMHVNKAVADESDIGKTRLSGVIMLDYALAEGVNRDSETNSSEFNSEVRKARIDIKHQLNESWSAKLQLGFNEEDRSSEVGDAYIRYRGLNQAVLTMGQFKEPFGLENLTSSKNTTFLERSMVTRALSSGKNQGVMLSGSPSDFTWAFSIMEIENEDKEAAPFAVDGRATWAIINESQQLLHLGASTSLRKLDGEIFEIDERIELHSSEKIIESGEIEVDQMQLNALELAMVKDAFSFQVEYLSADIEATESSNDVIFDGYYMQASFFLSQDTRRYKKGVFTGVKPSSHEGAWELTARYSELNTQDVAQGNKVNTTTVGLNYYYDQNLRLMTNLLHTQSSEEINGSDTGNALAFRAQYVF